MRTIRKNEMLATNPSNQITVGQVWKAAGQAANQAAARNVFTDYQERKARNTQRRQSSDLALFRTFLEGVGLPVGDLMSNPEAWEGITWGIVEAFTRWQLQSGYAVSSVNIRLSTVKTFAKLAMKAGAISVEDTAMIRTVSGYQYKEIKHIDDARTEAGTPTRKGAKKAQATHISTQAARKLKECGNIDTPQGRRDRLFMCILLDHGLRVGELAILERNNFNLEDGTLTFYRPKVNKTQTHQLTPATLAAARAYLEHDAPAEGIIWLGSRKDATLQGSWSARAMTNRVRVLGSDLGIEQLSAHDCRHFWATAAVRNGTQLDRLQDAGGWSSLAMPARYVEAARISNMGVHLDANPDV
jgi:integrase